MSSLFEFLKKYHHWFVFLLLEAISGVLLFQFNSYHGSVWFSTANAVAGKVYACESWVRSFFTLSKVNEELTLRNAFLEHQIAIFSERLADLSSDSVLMQSSLLMQLGDYQLIPAKVITNEVNKLDNLITIDKGEADGVQRDMGVVSGTGIVGIVYLTSDHYSVVIPVLNSHSNISCTLAKRGYFGYLRWYGKESNVAYVDDIPRHAVFHKGDSVVTSGYSSIFPAGIMVGTVSEKYNSADGLSYLAQVKLSTDFSRLRDVCVISDANMRERMQVLRQARDSLSALR